MNKIVLLLCIALPSFSTYAQTVVTGLLKDMDNNEALMQGVILFNGKPTETDLDGNYRITLPAGDYKVDASYVGYLPYKKTIAIQGKTMTLDISLDLKQVTEVKVVGDIAKTRETPVAFSTIDPIKIREELSTQDLPMVLNSTPGVYATQTGGGIGDARVSLRGFSQQNIAVMLDGVPVNDMENGQVYWSNWPGLDVVTKQMQVQRGLGASKLAIPAVGGSINVLTKGIDSKLGATVKQEFASGNYYKTTLGFTSGKLKGGWGVTFAASYLQAAGWVNNMYGKQLFGYLKIEKRIGDNHTLTISAMGAPQEHGQRRNRLGAWAYDTTYAKNKLGVDTNFSGIADKIVNKGLRYNLHTGTRTLADGSTETINEAVNFYFKPIFNFKHFWNVSDQFSLSTIVYASYGNGGARSTPNSLQIPRTNDEARSINWDAMYAENTASTHIDPLYSTTEKKADPKYILRSSMNNHSWYGLLSTFNYHPNQHIELSGGLDIRTYRGFHYVRLENLLGADYYVDNVDKNQTSKVKKVGDKIAYNNDGVVKWAGAFMQLEYKKDKYSGFVSASFAETGYQRVDYFRKKDIVLQDTTLNEIVGAGETVNYKGTNYTIDSKEARAATTQRIWLPGYTLKGGLNYNINAHHNVFANVGYLSRAPKFNNVFDNANKLYQNIKNEIVQAVELGYSFKKAPFLINVNGYYTNWLNKPFTRSGTTLDGQDWVANITGIGALHKGIELDLAWAITPTINWEVVTSIGDWTWKGKNDKLIIYNQLTNDSLTTVSYDATGVHVGDAAQIQVASAIRVEIIKGLFIKPRITFFDKNYANFDPFTLNGVNAGRESWKLPSYYTLDIHAGYEYKLKNKYRLGINGSVLNALNAMYISDASNGFDAYKGQVYMGQGRRYSLALTLGF